MGLLRSGLGQHQAQLQLASVDCWRVLSLGGRSPMTSGGEATLLLLLFFAVAFFLEKEKKNDE